MSRRPNNTTVVVDVCARRLRAQASYVAGATAIATLFRRRLVARFLDG